MIHKTAIATLLALLASLVFATDAGAAEPQPLGAGDSLGRALYHHYSAVARAEQQPKTDFAQVQVSHAHEADPTPPDQTGRPLEGGMRGGRWFIAMRVGTWMVYLAGVADDDRFLIERVRVSEPRTAPATFAEVKPL